MSRHSTFSEPARRVGGPRRPLPWKPSIWTNLILARLQTFRGVVSPSSFEHCKCQPYRAQVEKFRNCKKLDRYNFFIPRLVTLHSLRIWSLWCVCGVAGYTAFAAACSGPRKHVPRQLSVCCAYSQQPDVIFCDFTRQIFWNFLTKDRFIYGHIKVSLKPLELHLPSPKSNRVF